MCFPGKKGKILFLSLSGLLTDGTEVHKNFLCIPVPSVRKKIVNRFLLLTRQQVFYRGQ